jgi:hypothetical protein
MAIREDIIHAFSKTPYPGDEALTECSCPECRWEVQGFVGKRWSRITLADFVDEEARIPALSPAAFHYFLPGLMLLVLDHLAEAEFLQSWIIDRFTCPDYRVERQLPRVNNTLRRLTARQREVVVAFIRDIEPNACLVPEILRATIAGLQSGEAQPYSLTVVQEWVARLPRPE